ncbi:MAG TPA: zf-HC2 domain-containing protein [Pyrinomonadaceae bacterium]|nr:zf-HC2 domain-containing protein [Pyrinomonadaceae bacterium]
METCLDEGTLQAYLDGELSPETLNGVASHLAACDACAEAAQAATAELALFSTAFAPVMQASVPTARLRARLDEAIAEMNAPARRPATAAAVASTRVRSFFESLASSLKTFTPRQATAFASLLVAVALAVVFFALIGSPDGADSSKEIAGNIQTPAPAAPTDARTNDSPAKNDQVAALPSDEENSDEEIDAPAPARRSSGGSNPPAFTKAGLNARPQEAARTRVESSELAAAPANPAPASEPVLEDEKTYLTSIASLTSAIEAQGAEGMTPTLRAEYARNLAVVNQAIVASRVAARRNPQDTDAKEFLRAAYQNKVELLSAVADQTQLASSLD